MENDTLRKAIDTYGNLMQIIVAIEEMAELTKELCKQLRGRDNLEEIAEEIADVEIVLAEQQIMFDCAGKVKAYEAAKIQRLRERLEGTECGTCVDTVEVVRCRECFWYQIRSFSEKGPNYDCRKTQGLLNVKPDDFCSYGKRRADP